MSKQESMIRRAAAAVVIGLAVVMTAANVYTAWQSKHRTPSAPLRIIPDWRSLVHGGHRVGGLHARTELVEFLDYQCPACREMWARTDKLIAQYPDSLSVVIHYAPSPAHPMALPAAIAAECASRQQAFDSYNELLFRSDISWNDISWSHLAASSGVHDGARFGACLQDSSAMNVVRSDASTVSRFGASGTPVWLIDGEVFEGLPWDFAQIVADHVKHAN